MITRDHTYAARTLRQALLAAGQESPEVSELERRPLPELLADITRLAHVRLDQVGEAQRRGLLARHAS